MGMKKAIAGFAITIAMVLFLTSCGFVYKTASDIVGDDLSDAVVSGNLERVKEAVENGADVNKKNAMYALHEIPLLYAIDNSYTEIAKYLLAAGANPNYVDKRNGISLLMYTVGGYAESGITYANASFGGMYRVLLEDPGTDINLTGKLGYTALDYACRDNGRLDIVNDLIDHGAMITVTTMRCAFEGFQKAHCEESVLKLVYDNLTKQGIPSGLDPEIEAALQGDSDTLISFVKAGRIKEENKPSVLFLTCAYGEPMALKLLCDNNVNISESIYGKTLLGIACAYGNIKNVQYLVEEGADIHIQADEISVYHKKTPLSFALKYGHLDIADYLMEHGAELEIAESGTSGNRPDALEIACGSGNLDVVKWVVEHGYPLEEDRVEQSMAAAAQYDHINVLEYFLTDLQVDIDSEYYYATVLTDSAYSSAFETIEFLVDNGADVNGGKDRKFTPLDGAVRSNRADVVQFLLDNGAVADGQDSPRPLTVAIQNGYFDIVKILIDHGAALSYKEGWTSGEDTPLEIAEREKSQHIIEYIKNALGNEQ